ncbi:MAG: fatty acid desaturase [Burkholderiales bacterium]|nr:fatty acid desaturase [Opitutaceae bacterium]
MNHPASSLLHQEPPLKDYTETVRQNAAISWYRTKLPPGALKELHEKSDLQGAIQTFGHLAILALLGAGAWYSSHHGPWWATASLVFAYAMAASFAINAVHELGHGTVFKTRALNTVFCHVFAFLGWINHEVFQSSHIRHHRYTLHPPDDLEVVLPARLLFRHVLTTGIFNPAQPFAALRETVRIARGAFRGEWELTLYPASDPAARRGPMRWARVILLGNLAILALAVFTGQWILPVLSWGHLAVGSWLFFLCNNTQHIGLQDNVDDFRLCCRTYTLNPVVRFLYWQMNYHIEHHMFAAVPCYRLGRLHQLIRHDLPPTPAGLFGVWREINSILREQARNPAYQHQAPLPENALAQGTATFGRG